MNPGGDPPLGLIMYAIGVPTLATMAIFAMLFALLAFRARMRAVADSQYKALAERTAAAQSDTAASVAALKAQLADIAASLAAVEKMLKQVG